MIGEDVIYGDKPSQQAQLVFGQDRLCAGRGGRFRGTGQHLALSRIWRRSMAAASFCWSTFVLAFTFGYTMIVAETALGRMTTQEPGGRLPHLRQGKGPVLRRMDQRHHPHPDRPLLLRHWRLGDQVPRGVHSAATAVRWRRTSYFSSFISNGFSSELCFVVFALFTLAIIFAGVHNGIERVSKLMMPVLAVLSVIIAIYSVTRPGALAGVKYFPGAQSGEFLVDDRRLRHGADVLFAVHRHGHSHHLRLVHEEGRLHRRLHPERGDFRHRHRHHGGTDDYPRGVRLLRRRAVWR